MKNKTAVRHMSILQSYFDSPKKAGIFKKIHRVQRMKKDQEKNIQDIEARLKALEAENQIDLRKKIDLIVDLAWSTQNKDQTSKRSP